MKSIPDSFLASMRSSIQDRRGVSGAFMADQFKEYQWGVKLPHLMLEYLFGLNVVPMPSLIELAGLPGSCKSSFLQYLMRIFAENGMNAEMIETEGKMSWTLLDSFLGEFADRVLINQGPMSQEEWMAELLNAMKVYRDAYAKSLKAYNDKHPLLAPFLIGLDSLGGAPSNETMKTTDKDKSVGRSFPIEALKNSRFFPQIPVRSRDLPLVIVYTNHEQTRIAEQKGSFTVQGQRSSQGGHRPGFFCGLRIFFEQTSKPKPMPGGLTVQNLKLEVVKNSFSEKGHVVGVPMCWRTEIDEEGNDRQVTWFDWHRTLAEFLSPSVGDPKIPKSVLKQFLTVERHSEVSFSCRELGLTKVTPTELGMAIEKEPDIVDELRPLMGIKKWKVYDGKPLVASIKGELDMPDPDLNVTEKDAEGYDGGDE